MRIYSKLRTRRVLCGVFFDQGVADDLVEVRFGGVSVAGSLRGDLPGCGADDDVPDGGLVHPLSRLQPPADLRLERATRQVHNLGRA